MIYILNVIILEVNSGFIPAGSTSVVKKGSYPGFSLTLNHAALGYQKQLFDKLEIQILVLNSSKSGFWNSCLKPLSFYMV